MTSRLPENIFPIDCHYVRENLAASFLIKGASDSVIIETGHPGAVTHILSALAQHRVDPGSISHIVVTHVHLDHCGGVGGLIEACPNAKVVCHPRAKLHLSDPARLIKGSKVVYGEPLFNSLYGNIEPVAKEKIIAVEDTETIEAAGTTFTFYHMAGHARHHICIHEAATNTVFTGDTFGVAYPDLQLGNRRFIYPATTPSDFDIPEARKSIQRLLDLRADSAWLTHFGNWSGMEEGAEQLLFALAEIEKIQTDAATDAIEGQALNNFCHERLKNFVIDELEKRDLSLTREQWKVFDYDIKLNSLGIAYAADKSRKKLER